MNLQNIYAELEAGRRPYLDKAEEVAAISLPDLNVKRPMLSHSADLYAKSRPYSNAAAHAIGRLATNLQALVVPPSTNWFMLDLPVDVKLTLQMSEAQGQVPQGMVEQLQAMARQAETLVLEKMAEHDLYGKIGDAFRRLLIEGQVVFHISRDFLRTIPLRCFVVQRFNGNVEKLVIKEEYKQDGEEYDLYTLVDYKTGKVYQQKSTSQDAQVISDTPRQYFVASSMVRDYEDYATSLACIHHPTIYSINKLARDMQEIAHWMGRTLLGIGPTVLGTGSPQNFKEQLERGDNIFATPAGPNGTMEGISFFSAQAKAGDYAALAAERQQQEAMLAQSFALGITSQSLSIAGRERVTAQEIAVRSMDVDADAQSHASTLMSTFQRPLVQAYLEVLQVQLSLPDGRDTVKPVILAGANLLSRMVKVNQLLGSIATIANIPETPFTASLNRQALFLEVAQAQGYQNAERFLLPPEAQQPPMGGQQV